MSSIDLQFVEFIIKSLVSKPDAVKIDRRIDEKGVLLELTVDPEDLGRVIGKRGATAQSVRTLLRALGTKNDARYNLKIVDNGPADRGVSSDTSTSGSGSWGADEPSAPVTDDASATVSSTADLVDEDDLPATTAKDEDHSSVVSKTRAELEELDDLDI